MRREWMKGWLLTVSLGLMLDVVNANPAMEDAQNLPAWPISQTETNLLMVDGQKIVDVIFDEQMLDIIPNADRGSVFVRVKAEKPLLAEAKMPDQEGGSTKKNARGQASTLFVNTAQETLAVRLVPQEVASQRVVVSGHYLDTDLQNPLVENQIHPQNMPTETRLSSVDRQVFAPLTESDYEAQLKTLVQLVMTGDWPAVRDRRTQSAALSIGNHEFTSDLANGLAVGSLMSEDSQQAVTVEPVQTVLSMGGFSVRTVKAIATDQFFVERLQWTNVSGRTQSVPMARLAQMIPQVLAIGLEHMTVAARGSTAVVIIRARRRCTGNLPTGETATLHWSVSHLQGSTSMSAPPTIEEGRHE